MYLASARQQAAGWLPMETLATSYFYPAYMGTSVLFLASAAVSAWVSPAASAHGRLLLIAIGLVLVLLLRWVGRVFDRCLQGIAVCATLGIVALAVAAGQGVPGEAVAAAMITLIPLSLLGVATATPPRTWRSTLLPMVGLGAGLAALIGAGERSAVVAAFAALGIVSLLGWNAEASSGRRSVRMGYFALGLLLAGSLLLLLLSVLSVPADLVMVLRQGWGLDRLQLWRNALVLAQDYWLSGVGLDAIGPALSAYIYLVHVPLFSQLYNLPLHIAVEQGLPGVIAFVQMVGLTLAVLIGLLSNRQLRAASILAGISWCGLMFHGLVDAGLYSTRLVPLAFVPFGVIWALQARAARMSAQTDLGLGSMVAFTLGSAWVLLLLLLPGTQARLHLNLGAVYQSQAELSVYTWPAWPIQDALRRSSEIDLAPALDHYASALAADPELAGAHRRLGQILLSRGDYTAAGQHLELAYHVAPWQRPTRQLLGEAYAVTGSIEPAAALWHTVTRRADHFESRRWWYEHTGSTAELARLEQVLGLLRSAGSKAQPSD